MNNEGKINELEGGIGFWQRARDDSPWSMVHKYLV